MGLEKYQKRNIVPNKKSSVRGQVDLWCNLTNVHCIIVYGSEKFELTPEMVLTDCHARYGRNKTGLLASHLGRISISPIVVLPPIWENRILVVPINSPIYFHM